MSMQTNEHIFKKGFSIQKLTKETLIDIYSTHSVRHFPANERKPIASIERMIDEGVYIGYGLYSPGPGDGGCWKGSSLLLSDMQLLGYAFFTVPPGQQICLLDYFAIMEDYRSLGLGSLFLQHMKASAAPYQGFLIESEDPDYANGETELSIRRKRLDFYGKNGALPTGIKATVFGVPYRLLFFPLQDTHLPDEETLCEHFSNIYQRMVSPHHYEANVHIYPHSGTDFCKR